MAIGMPLGFPPLAKAAEVEHALARQSLGFTDWHSFLFKRSRAFEEPSTLGNYQSFPKHSQGRHRICSVHAFHSHVLPVKFRGLLADLDRYRMEFYLEKTGHHKDPEQL